MRAGGRGGWVGGAGRGRAVGAGGAARRRGLEAAGVGIDYATIRDAHTLRAPTPSTSEHRAIVTAIVGGVRLLDNGPWPGG